MTHDPLHMLVHIVGVLVTLVGLALVLLILGALFIERALKWCRVYDLFWAFVRAELQRRADAKKWGTTALLGKRVRVKAHGWTGVVDNEPIDFTRRVHVVCDWGSAWFREDELEVLP